jgi:hypothetical protein
MAPDPIIGARNSHDIHPSAAYLRESGEYGIPLIFFQQGQKASRLGAQRLSVLLRGGEADG